MIFTIHNVQRQNKYDNNNNKKLFEKLLRLVFWCWIANSARSKFQINETLLLTETNKSTKSTKTTKTKTTTTKTGNWVIYLWAFVCFE